MHKEYVKHSLFTNNQEMFCFVRMTTLLADISGVKSKLPNPLDLHEQSCLSVQNLGLVEEDSCLCAMTEHLEQSILDMDNNPVMRIISAFFNRALPLHYHITGKHRTSSFTR